MRGANAEQFPPSVGSSSKAPLATVPNLSTAHADPVLKHHFRLGQLVTTVDCRERQYPTRQLRRKRQTGRVADRIVVTKTTSPRRRRCGR